MLVGETHYTVGDCVRVLVGIQDPDWSEDIAGWQGRVLNVERSKRSKPIILIAWDSVTLRQMPAAMIEKCEVEGLDWAEMALAADEIEAAACRDSPQDVERARKELGKQYHWVHLGEEGKRIHQVLAGADLDDEMHLLHRWEEHLARHLIFPFEAVIAELPERGPLHGGDKVKVWGIELVDDSYGVIVGVRRGREKFAVPLCDLQVTPKNAPNYQMVKDYVIWFANR